MLINFVLMDMPLASLSLRDGFLEEHGKIEDLLGQVIAAVEGKDPASTMTLWGRFRTTLLLHLEAEDGHLIPALPRVYDTNARVLGQEHQHIRTRVSELNAAGLLEAKQLVELRALRDILRAHRRNDDRLLYAWADTQLDEVERNDALSALADRLRSLAG